jgi:hypothetical protein
MERTEDFIYISNPLERERLQKIYNIITKLHLWDFLQKDNIDLLAFGNMLNILREVQSPKSISIDSHFFGDFNVILAIAKRGEESYKQDYIKQKENYERLKGREWEQEYYRENYMGGCTDRAIPPPI